MGFRIDTIDDIITVLGGEHMKEWVTVFTHRSYEIQIHNSGVYHFGYRINDPAFLPDYKRYNTIAEAVEAIDKATK